MWWLPGEPLDPLQSRWGSLASLLPHIAYRCRTADMQRVLHQLLERGGWDGIVFDGISVGWALAPVRAFYGDRSDRPRLIYVSHNHEESLRHQVAESQRAFFRRQAVRLDASKVVAAGARAGRLGRLRHRHHAGGSASSTTPARRQADGRADAGLSRPEALPARDHQRGAAPRRDRRQLRLDRQAHEPRGVRRGRRSDVRRGRRRAGQAVGSAEERFLKRLRERTKASQFTGTVPDVTRYMDEARIAIVPERNGGGFKLKVLEYVFNRIPVFALRGSFAGVPLVHDDSVMLYPDHEALARGVLDSIDDIERLNRLQERAFAACRDRFDWASRGRQILSLIAS